MDDPRRPTNPFDDPDPQDPVAIAKKINRAVRNPFDVAAEDEAARTDPMRQYHEGYKSGRLQKNVAELNAADQAQGSVKGRALDTAQEMAEFVGSLIPGGKNAIAGGRALNKKPLLTNGRPTVATPAEAAEERRALDNSLGATERGSPRVFGGTGADEGLPIIGKPWNPKLTTLATAAITAPAAARLPGSAVQVGGMLGGMYGAADSDPAASTGRKLLNTAIGTATGAAVPAVLARAGRAGANISGKIGLTDAIGDAAEKSGATKFANSIGSRGAANRLLREQEGVPSALGQDGLGSAESQLIKHAQETEQTSEALFKQAARDKKIIEDPTVLELSENPLVQKAIGWAKQVRRLSGKDVPSREIPEVRTSTIVDQFGRPSEVETFTRTEALDPQLLHYAKMHIQDVVGGKLRGTLPGEGGLSTAEATAIQESGVLNKLTNRLHELSPAYKVADDYFSTRVNFQDGFEKGMEVAGKPLKQAASQAATSSLEAVQAWAQEPLTWAKPRPDLAQQRMAGLDAGHRAGLANQVRDVPIEQGGRGILSKAPFSNAPDAVARRSSLSTGKALNQSLNDLTRTVSEREAVAARPDASAIKPWTWGRTGNKPFDFLSTPRGQQILQQRAGTRSQPSLPPTPDALMALLRRISGKP